MNFRGVAEVLVFEVLVYEVIIFKVILIEVFVFESILQYKHKKYEPCHGEILQEVVQFV